MESVGIKEEIRGILEKVIKGMANSIVDAARTNFFSTSINKGKSGPSFRKGINVSKPKNNQNIIKAHIMGQPLLRVFEKGTYKTGDRYYTYKDPKNKGKVYWKNGTKRVVGQTKHRTGSIKSYNFFEPAVKQQDFQAQINNLKDELNEDITKYMSASWGKNNKAINFKLNI